MRTACIATRSRLNSEAEHWTESPFRWVPHAPPYDADVQYLSGNSLGGGDTCSLQQILSAWNFKALCCPDVAFMCARKIPTRRHTPARGRPVGRHGYCPTRAVRHRCQPSSRSVRHVNHSRSVAILAPHCEEKGEHVRLDWGSTPPPPTFVCTHSSAAALITPEAWTEPFACRFRASDHINVLELVALVSLIRRLSNQGARRQRILCCVDSRVVLGAVTKGRSPSRKLTSCASLLTGASLPRSPSTCCGCRRGPPRRTHLRGTSLWTAGASAASWYRARVRRHS